MGVQCALLGHAFDATEFEEERRERPQGSVLVCREYQVCKRCGTRQELYRNEQLLPNETGTGGESEEQAAGDGGVDPTALGDDAETADSDAPDSAPAVGETTADDGEIETELSGGTDATVISTPDEGDDLSGDAKPTDRAYGEWPGEARDNKSGPEATGRRETASSESVEATGGVGTPTDDAVVLTSSDDEGEDGPKMYCPNCDRTWTRAETSLRDGDLCPACREGYVEPQ